MIPIEKCNYCGKPIGTITYMWKGLSPKFCSVFCSVNGCPIAILEKHMKMKK
jgi:hypothetical protein